MFVQSLRHGMTQGTEVTGGRYLNHNSSIEEYKLILITTI